MSEAVRLNATAEQQHPIDGALGERSLYAYRLVQWAVLAALVWKLAAFIQMVRVYFAMPLTQDFFPVWLESTWTVLIAYIMTLLGLAAAALAWQRSYRVIASATVLATISVLCVHQGSYNDMTFATAWWSSLWSLWMATRLDVDDDPTLIRRAAFASRCIASMVLLGGAVGKWTDEYWSGLALYEIYYLDRDFWFFNLQRRLWDANQLRSVATWYSRLVIVVESCCGCLLWLLPARWAAVLGMTVFTTIALFSNFNLFSVLLSMIGLAAVGLFVPSVPRPIADRTSRAEQSA